ncbi:MAG: Gldg family protein [Planctomycetota bacterium]|nr:Gldg family protein [Planctomycetota bacterium]
MTKKVSGIFFRRAARGLDLALFLAALLTIVVVVNYFARRPEARLKLDATKTRAYSLSEQTRDLLASLDGRWTIALLMAEEATDAATRKQIDEVLRRYAQASEAISIVRIDPTDPRTLEEYEALLGRLRGLEADRIAEYEQALDAGADAFADLQLFARRQAVQLEQVLGLVGEDDPARREIQQRLGLLGLLAEEGGQVLDAVAEARRISEAQPIPDYAGARSSLATALSQWADELYAMARTCEDWLTADETNAVVKRWASSVIDEYEKTARDLARAADPLAHLPPLELASIGRQLRRGEAAVIIGPDRAAIIRSDQLLPRIRLGRVDEETVAFDRRFRGEQVISAAIRSLLVEQMPMVVFAHAEDPSMLRADAQRADLVGIASLLETYRFDVREWRVGEDDRPLPVPGQRAVWIVIPPTSRESLEPDRKEIALLRGAADLIADGEAVMLNVYPSLLPRYKQTDPWQRLAKPFALRPDTARTVYEAVRLGQDRFEYDRGQAVQRFETDHPISRAVHGQQAYFVLPVPIAVMDEETTVRHDVLATVKPGAHRWLEADWATKTSAGDEIERGEPFDEPLPIVVAGERQSPMGGRVQRFILVGSGGWMLSYVADAMTGLGGERYALTNPGNQELMLASVHWLGGMDELIAPSAVSRQVARLDGIDSTVALTWGLIAVVGAPLGCLLLGVLVWLGRRI